MDPSTHSPGMQPMTARDLMLKLQQSRAANGAARIVPTRKRSFVPDSGFTTFTAGIRIGWQQEILSRKFRQAVAAEFMAMSLFVALGSAVVVFTASMQDKDVRQLIISSGFGLMISVMVFAVGDISGANLNPAVTLSLFLTKKMSLLRFLSYVFAQCMGAMVGSGYIKSLSPDLFNSAGGAANAVSTAPDINLWTAVGGEILGTMLLVFTVSAAADVGRETHRKYVGALTPLCIGGAVFLAHIFLIPIDGCSINPARSFGSAVTMNKWTDHWVFWVGPLVGGPLAAFAYDFIFKMPPTATEIAEDVASAIERSGSDRERGREASTDLPSDGGSFALPGAVLEATTASPPRSNVSTTGVVTVKMPRMPPIAPAPQSQMPQILVPGMASVSANPMSQPPPSSAFRNSLVPPATTTMTGTTFRNSLVPSTAGGGSSMAPPTSSSPAGAPLLARAISSRGVASPDHTTASTSIASGDASSVVEMASRQPVVGEWR